jgi:hypothetical protein
VEFAIVLKKSPRAMRAGSLVDPARIVECFTRYLDHEGLRVSRAEFADS